MSLNHPKKVNTPHSKINSMLSIFQVHSNLRGKLVSHSYKFSTILIKLANMTIGLCYVKSKVPISDGATRT